MKPNAAPRLELVLLGGAPGAATILASHGRARVVAELATKGGAAGERMRRIIAFHEGVLRALDGRSAAPLPSKTDLVEYGAVLFETLFPGDVRRLYDTARSRAGSGRLDVVFTSPVDWVAAKPWELAYDPARRAFLAAEDVNFVRDVITAVASEAPRPRRGPLRVLLAAAQPRGAGRVSAGQELALVAHALEPLVAADRARVEVLRSATPESLHAALEASRPDVLHFIGHGVYDRGRDAGALVLESASGDSRTIDADVLRRLLAGRGLGLVVLNACESARGGRDRGVAFALAAGGIGAVVANQYRVLDSSAKAFAGRFYEALAAGRTLGDAVREGRTAISYAPAETIGWAVPVLFARDPGLVLWPRAGPRSRSR